MSIRNIDITTRKPITKLPTFPAFPIWYLRMSLHIIPRINLRFPFTMSSDPENKSSELNGIDSAQGWFPPDYWQSHRDLGQTDKITTAVAPHDGTAGRPDGQTDGHYQIKCIISLHVANNKSEAHASLSVIWAVIFFWVRILHCSYNNEQVLHWDKEAKKNHSYWKNKRR